MDLAGSRSCCQLLNPGGEDGWRKEEKWELKRGEKGGGSSDKAEEEGEGRQEVEEKTKKRGDGEGGAEEVKKGGSSEGMGEGGWREQESARNGSVSFTNQWPQPHRMASEA